MKKSRLLCLSLLTAVGLWSFVAPPRPQTTPQSENALPAPGFRQVVNNSFKAGERALYRVHYGFLTAGTAEFVLDPNLTTYNNKECYRIHGYVKTASAFEWFYTVRSEFHTYMDKSSLVPWQYTRKTREGDFRLSDTVTFDYNKKLIQGGKGKFKMEDYTQDVMSAFYYARCLNLKEAPNGTVHRIQTFMDDKVYNLGLTVIKRETIKTEFGKVRCIKIAPFMAAGRVFKEDDQMYLWVTDDDNYLPIHVESPVTVGSIKCDLIKYENLRNPFSSLVKK